jgi:1-phosphofructokinase
VFAPSTIVTVTVENSTDEAQEAEVHFHAGGQGFWIARLLGRLGVPTTICTVFGGEAGRVASTLVEGEPIEVRAVRRQEGNGCWVHDRRSGERHVVAEVAGAALGRHETDELVGAAMAAALRHGICVLTGPQHPGVIDASHYGRMATDLRANGVEVIVDLSGPPLRSSLGAGIDFCKVSEEDLSATEGAPPSLHPLDGLEWLLEHGALRAVITRGEESAMGSVNRDPFEVETPTFQVVDHRGAGDAFTALVAAARYWGLDWDDAVRWGAAAGALTVLRRGLATADRNEIHQLLDRIQLRSARP